MELINLPFIFSLLGLIIILLIINLFFKPSKNSKVINSKITDSNVTNSDYSYIMLNTDDDTNNDCSCHSYTDDFGSSDCDCGSDCGGGGCD